MLELYHSGLTTCSKQVRHCLREKGLPYKSRYVELWRYENLSPSTSSSIPTAWCRRWCTTAHRSSIRSASTSTSRMRFRRRRCVRPIPRNGRACATGPGPRTRSISARAADPRPHAAERVQRSEPAEQQTMLKSNAGAGETRALGGADQGRLFADQLAAALDGVLFVFTAWTRNSRSAGRGSPASHLFAWRHQYARHRASHLRAVSRQARPHQISRG